jgi:hypothetical protein
MWVESLTRRSSANHAGQVWRPRRGREREDKSEKRGGVETGNVELAWVLVDVREVQMSFMVGADIPSNFSTKIYVLISSHKVIGNPDGPFRARKAVGRSSITYYLCITCVKIGAGHLISLPGVGIHSRYIVAR